MFTVQNLIDRIRFLVAEQDPANTFFDDADIIKSINYQLDNLYADLELPNNSITLNLTSGTMEYNLPSTVENVYTVWFTLDNIRYKVEYNEFDDDFLTRFDDNYTNNIITNYYIKQRVIADEYIIVIGFYPIPNVNMTMNLEVLSVSPAITLATDKIPLHNRYLVLLAYLVLADMYQRDKSYNEAQFVLSMYNEEVTQEKLRLKGRAPEYVNI